MSTEPDAVSYHDALATGWEQRYGRGGFARRSRFFERAILPALPVGGAWLDAGCGTGTFSRLLARSGRSVVGVDASANMIGEAIRQTSDMQERPVFSRIDSVEQLPFGPAAFDGIICFSVLEYLDRPFDALEEMARVLKPGGTLVCSVPHQASALRAGQKAYRLLRGRQGGLGYLDLSRFTTSPSAMRKSVTPLGLTIRQTIGFDPILPRIAHAVLRPSLIYFIARKN